jgi:hypothetical protein
VIFLANIWPSYKNVPVIEKIREGFSGMNPDGTRLTTSDPLGHQAMTRLDLNGLIRKVVQLDQAERHGRNIALILDLDKNLPKIKANSRQIEWVLLALVARSRNVIVEAGRLYGTITVCTRVRPGKVQFSLTTDGVVDPDSRVPGTFFTRTLEEDMNVTMCAEIVQDHAGELYSWRPYGSPLATLGMDLPTAD